MIEQLESRLLLSTVKAGLLTVTGGKKADVITIIVKKSTLTLTINNKVEKFKTSQVKRITINGGKGNDNISTKGKMPALNVIGGLGNDAIVGTPGNDTIDGGAGNDSIAGMAGNDLLIGGAGKDYLLGQAGNDTINGDADDDILVGDMGNDSMHGGDGNDIVKVGDECWPGTAHEAHTCFAIPANSDNDIGYGDGGNDTINAGKGSDSVYGGDGNDSFQIYNNDPTRIGTVDGGAGNDTIGKTGTLSIVSNVEVFT